MRRVLSSLAQACSSEPDIASDVSRNAFVQTVLLPPKPIEGHTHPTAAALRTSATNFARLMAASIGGRLYSLSMSRSDQRKNIAGERQWYWAKDVNARNANDQPADRDLHYMCDVDYYKDMPKFLAEHQKPLLLYTVVPEDAASSGRDDTSFAFQSDGSLETTVAGGGCYRHQLWDYGMDSVLVVAKFFGIPYKATVFSIERRRVGYSRQLVLLAPIRVFKHVGALIARYLLETKEVKRFNPIVRAGDQTFVRFRVQRNDGMYVTTARAGSFLSATVDCKTDEAIAAVSRLCTTNLPMPTVIGWVGQDRRPEAAMLTEYFRLAGPAKIPTVFPVEQAVRAYAYEPETYDPDERPKLEAFMSPLVHGAFCPVPNAAGERACVEGRINKLKKPEPKPNNFVFACMQEFAELVVGDAVLAPVEVEFVESKQTRPAQKLSLAKAYVAGPFSMMTRRLKCFIKSEAYSDVKDPRNISTYNDADKLHMAQFALALSEHLKQFDWYGPGKSPLAIARRVADIAQTARTYVNVSDLHRMDGTVTETLRLVDRMVFMKAFKDHGSELNDLLNRNFGNIGTLPHGTKFEQGPSHGSGCSATSTSQTLRTAFLAYLAFRHTVVDGGRHPTREEAFSKIGIHFGDDGLDADLPIRSHEWAARKVGLILEADVVHRGQPGITFLARLYSPAVWNGALDSMCDIRRQLSKFHTCVRLPVGVPHESKLVEKAYGYVATDANTPVIGELCRRAVEFCDEGLRRTALGISHWWAQFDKSVQYPNENSEGWMDAEFDRVYPEFDRRVFDQWLRSTRSIKELLGPPLCVEIRAATPTIAPVVVDGDVQSASCTSSTAPHPSGDPEPKPEKRTKTPRKVKSAAGRRRGKRRLATKASRA